MHRLTKTALPPLRTGLARFPLLVGLLLLLQACDIVNPPEPSGSYLRFEDPQVRLNDNSGFTSNIGIRDIWLYHNGFLQGVYPVQPIQVVQDWAVIPYILEPSNNFYIEGGIHESGLGSIHLPYPFWDRINFEVDQGAGDTFTITPIFEYLPEDRYNIEVDESFETNLISFLPFSTGLTNSDSTFLLRRSESVFQGQRAGYVRFGQSDRWFEVRSQNNFRLDRTKDVYAEITYRNSIEFTVGLVYEDVLTGNIGIEPVLNLRPSESWNTVYVHLIGQARQIINATSEDTNFWLWIQADGEGNEGFIYLDDIRLIQEE